MTTGKLVNPECVLGKIESHPGNLVNHSGECQNDPCREQRENPDNNSLTPNCQEVKITSIQKQRTKYDVDHCIEDVEGNNGDQEVSNDIIKDVVANYQRKVEK